MKVAIIGLGRFGMALAKHLGPSSVQVIAIDNRAALVNEIKDDVDIAVRLDSTDEQALLSQEIDKVDVCVISIGENFEAALLTTVIAKKIGVPEIICRAQTQFHAEIFSQIGADEVIQPESQAGEYIARKLANPHLEDFITLAEGYTLIEFQAPKAFRNKSLQQLALRKEYQVNLVAIKRPITPSISEDGEEEAPQVKIISVPKPGDVIQENDILLVIGSDEALAKLPKE